MKSFVPKDGADKSLTDVGKKPSVDFNGEKHRNETHASTTDDQARLFKKSAGDKSQPYYMGLH